jgi:hypothetical protein
MHALRSVIPHEPLVGSKWVPAPPLVAIPVCMYVIENTRFDDLATKTARLDEAFSLLFAYAKLSPLILHASSTTRKHETLLLGRCVAF